MVPLSSFAMVGVSFELFPFFPRGTNLRDRDQVLYDKPPSNVAVVPPLTLSKVPLCSKSMSFHRGPPPRSSSSSSFPLSPNEDPRRDGKVPFLHSNGSSPPFGK